MYLASNGFPTKCSRNATGIRGAAWAYEQRHCFGSDNELTEEPPVRFAAVGSVSSGASLTGSGGVWVCFVHASLVVVAVNFASNAWRWKETLGE